MAQVISIRVDDQVIDAVDKYAEEHGGISRSVAGKEILLKGLNDKPCEKSEAPKKTGKVKFHFTENLSYFIAGCDYEGYIAGNDLAVINFGGSYKVYDLNTIPAEAR